MSNGRDHRFLVAGLVTFGLILATPANAVPTMLQGSAISPNIGLDGVTGLNVVLNNSDGTLYDGPPLEVNFSSPCAIAGRAVLPETALTVGGIASVTYRPEGCAGLDPVSVRVAGDTSLSGSIAVFVSSRKFLSAKGRLGRAMFFDTSLSASGNLSCASCHAPANGYQNPGSGPTANGGTTGDAAGFRAVPSAAYASFMPAFAWQPPKAGDTFGTRGTPHGGLMWDGRAATLAVQARGPFTEPHEMANASNAATVQRLMTRPYFNAFAKTYGAVTPTSSPDQVVANMADAIAAFERQDPSFKLFTSKYDLAQTGRTSLTAQELNGQALFFNADKGACAGCHSSKGANQTKRRPQLFTDGSYRALGVPRNWALAYNDDGRASGALAALGRSSLANGASVGSPDHIYYDLGLCGPFRTDALLDPGLCGDFRVPSLRNVALKHSYEHNGVFGDLFQVLDFYSNREIAPERIYRTAADMPDGKYNDLPTQFQSNVRLRAPFKPLPNGAARLTTSDAKDIVAFLCTLTDGYDPSNPSGYVLPAQCRTAVH